MSNFEILKQEIIECRIRAKSNETIQVLSYLQEFAENNLNEKEVIDINHIESAIMNVINDFTAFIKPSREANAFVFDMLKKSISLALQEYNLNGGWISVDELPTQSDQYWVAYRPISNYNHNEKTTEICYCTAHFDSYDKIWSVKDQLFYTQRQCKVLFWQSIPQPPKE